MKSKSKNKAIKGRRNRHHLPKMIFILKTSPYDEAATEKARKQLLDWYASPNFKTSTFISHAEHIEVIYPKHKGLRIVFKR